MEKKFSLPFRFQSRAKRIERICNKVLQVYRIKVKCMYKREAVLKKIEHDPAALNDPHVHSILHTCLMREKKILEIGLKDYRKDLSLAEYAESELSSVAQKTKRFDGSSYMNGKVAEINGELHQFFHDFEIFMSIMMRGIEDIEHRILAEEKALESKDPNHFQEFLTLWEQEIEDNNKLESAYENLINSIKNHILLYKMYREYRERERTYAGGGGGASIAGGIGVIGFTTVMTIMVAHLSGAEVDSVAVMNFLKETGNILGLVFVVAICMIFITMLLTLEPAFRYEFQLDKFDIEMIEKIKHHSA